MLDTELHGRRSSLQDLPGCDAPEPVEATEADTEQKVSHTSKTLHLREPSVDDVKTPDMNQFTKLLIDLSFGAGSIATEDDEEDLSGTVTAQTTTDGVPSPNSKTPVPSPLNPQDLPSPVGNVKAVATGASPSPQEKARAKQQQRRQRKRSEKRNQLETRSGESPNHSNGAQNRTRPSPDERSMKFLLNLYEFDSPRIDVSSATNEELEAALSSSKILLHTKVDRSPHRTFVDRSDIAEFVNRTHQDIQFLKKQYQRLEKIRAQPFQPTEPTKLEYVARLLSALIGARGVSYYYLSRQLDVVDRYEKQSQESRLFAEQSRKPIQLRLDLMNFIPGSPVWNAIQSEIKDRERQLSGSNGVRNFHKAYGILDGGIASSLS